MVLPLFRSFPTMGVPYSKQIDLAFDQVGPFLQTAKFIILALGTFQILATLALGFVLGLIFLALIALLITVNPDLEAERRAIVTPVLRMLTRRVVPGPGTPIPGVRADAAGHRRREDTEKYK